MLKFPSSFPRLEQTWWCHGFDFIKSNLKDATSTQQIIKYICIRKFISLASSWFMNEMKFISLAPYSFGCLVYVFSQRCLTFVLICSRSFVFIYLTRCIWQPWLVKRFTFNSARKCCVFHVISCRVRHALFSFWKIQIF